MPGLLLRQVGDCVTFNMSNVDVERFEEGDCNGLASNKPSMTVEVRSSTPRNENPAAHAYTCLVVPRRRNIFKACTCSILYTCSSIA